MKALKNETKLDEAKRKAKKALEAAMRERRKIIEQFRGRADEYDCARCMIRKGANWTPIKGAHLDDMCAYQPMCRSCFQKYTRPEGVHWIKPEGAGHPIRIG